MLFKDEPETQALRQALARWPVRVASELIRVEAICTARRLGDPAMLERAKTALTRVTLLPLTAEVIDLATKVDEPAEAGVGRRAVPDVALGCIGPLSGEVGKLAWCFRPCVLDT